jgi:hypothetical protein
MSKSQKVTGTKLAIWYVLSVVVVSTLIAVFVIFPSNAEQSERDCAAMGAKYVGFGMCQLQDD